VTASWALNGTPIEGSTQVVRFDQTVTGGWIEFHLTWTGEGHWPRGTLSVALMANGHSAGGGSVPVAVTT
jgi:hypothetical protein